MSLAELDVLRLVFAGMKEKYHVFDVNGDGTITNQEFRQVLEEMVGEPCPDDDWNEFIQKVDYDNSGTVSFEEFLYALFLWFADDDDEETEDEEKDEVDQAFALLKNKFKETDTDRDNSISKKEFKQLLERLSPTKKITDELVTKILSELEDYKEGKSISFKEYLYGMYLFVKI